MQKIIDLLKQLSWTENDIRPYLISNFEVTTVVALEDEQLDQLELYLEACVILMHLEQVLTPTKQLKLIEQFLLLLEKSPEFERLAKVYPHLNSHLNDTRLGLVNLQLAFTKSA